MVASSAQQAQSMVTLNWSLLADVATLFSCVSCVRALPITIFSKDFPCVLLTCSAAEIEKRNQTVPCNRAGQRLA